MSASSVVAQSTRRSEGRSCPTNCSRRAAGHSDTFQWAVVGLLHSWSRVTSWNRAVFHGTWQGYPDAATGIAEANSNEQIVTASTGKILHLYANCALWVWKKQTSATSATNLKQQIKFKHLTSLIHKYTSEWWSKEIINKVKPGAFPSNRLTWTRLHCMFSMWASSNGHRWSD